MTTSDPYHDQSSDLEPRRYRKLLHMAPIQMMDTAAPGSNLWLDGLLVDLLRLILAGVEKCLLDPERCALFSIPYTDDTYIHDFTAMVHFGRRF